MFTTKWGNRIKAISTGFLILFGGITLANCGLSTASNESSNPTIITISPSQTSAPSITVAPSPTSTPIPTATQTLEPIAMMRQINKDGFGDLNNISVFALENFKGYLYAGTRNYLTGSDIWRYDRNEWEIVDQGGFGNIENSMIWDLFVFNKNIYASTGSDVYDEDGKWVGSELWRSSDGVNWKQVKLEGFPSTGIYPMYQFNELLYINTWEDLAGEIGAEIWRSGSTDTDDWSRVVTNGFGYPDNMSIVAATTYMDKLFVGTFTLDGTAQFYSTEDGENWTFLNDTIDGQIINRRVSAMAVFNDYLYSALISRLDSPVGRVYRCKICDGNDWELVLDGPYDFVMTYRKPGLEVYEGYLYYVVGNDHEGLELWRTSDGFVWEKLASEGIDDKNNQYTYFDSAMVIFDDKLYIGVENKVTGAEIWELFETTEYEPTPQPSPSPTPSHTPTPTENPYSDLPLTVDFDALLSECQAEVAAGSAEFKYVDFSTGATLSAFVDELGADCFSVFEPDLDREITAWIGLGSLEGWARDIDGFVYDWSFIEPGRHEVWVRTDRASVGDSGLFQIIDDELPTNPSSLIIFQPPWIPLEIIRFMQYNIEWGAGAHTSCIDDRPSGKNTLDQVIQIVRAADPDIMAVNEACHWGSGEIPIAGPFARSTGFYTFFVGADFIQEYYLPDAIFVKTGYQIIEKESLKPGHNGRGIRVKLLTPQKNEIVVYNVHLIPTIFKRTEESKQQLIDQAEYLAPQVKVDIDNGYRVIVTGDVNHWYETFEPIFRPIGLTPLDYENNGIEGPWFGEYDRKTYNYESPIDQVWIGPGLVFTDFEDSGCEGLFPLKDLILSEVPSDHAPECVGIYVMPLP